MDDTGAPIGGPIGVVLVDDHRMFAESLSRLLADEEGIRVVGIAANGAEALEMVARFDGSIDLVVSDVAMPRMRGDELANRLAELRPGLPVILVSGYDSGAVDAVGHVLPKPVGEEELLRAVREALDA